MLQQRDEKTKKQTGRNNVYRETDGQEEQVLLFSISEGVDEKNTVDSWIENIRYSVWYISFLKMFCCTNILFYSFYVIVIGV